MDKRRNKRLDAQLHVKISSGRINYWGIVCDVSENGLLVKCTRDFAMDTTVAIEIFMPDSINSLLMGVVKRKVEIQEPYRKHGIGIQLTKRDARYERYLKSASEKTTSRTS